MGLELRPIDVADEDDLAAVTAVQNAANLAEGTPRATTTEEWADELVAPYVDPASDTRLALLDGAVAGFAYTYVVPATVRLLRCYLFGAVAPDRRERGVGRALMSWSIERARERLRDAPAGLPTCIRAEAAETATATQRLFERCGMAPVRWFEELLRPLDDLPDLVAPDGVAVVPWPAADADGPLTDAALLEVRNASFEDHWGSTPTPPEGWHQQVRGFGGRPDLSRVAVELASGRPVGVCVNQRYEADDELVGRREGWIAILGTLREWRGRGVASALVASSLHAFAGAGLTHAAIGVDGDSPTGAARLYRQLGFVPTSRRITFELGAALSAP